MAIHPLEYAFPGAPDYLTAAAFEQHYGEFGQGYALPATPMSTEETNKFYAQQLAAHAGQGPRLLGYPGMASEDLMSMFGQPAIFANPIPTGHLPNGYQPYQFYQFQELPIRPQFARQHHELFSRDPESAYAQAHANAAHLVGQGTPGSQNNNSSSNKDRDSHDPDLKTIVSYVASKEPIVTPMDVIKFLSETPLEEMSHSAAADGVRKNRLCRELLSMIQDDLRNAIQCQLMSGEDILGGSNSASSSKESNQNQGHHAHQSSQPQQTQSNRKRSGRSPGTATESGNSSSQQQNKKGGGQQATGQQASHQQQQQPQTQQQKKRRNKGKGGTQAQAAAAKMQSQAEKSPQAHDNKEQPSGIEQNQAIVDEHVDQKETASVLLGSEQSSTHQGGDQASESGCRPPKAKSVVTVPSSNPSTPSQTTEAPQPTAQPAGHGGSGKRRKNKQKQHQQQPQGAKTGSSQEVTASTSAPQQQESPIVIQDQMQDVFAPAKNKNQIKAQIRKQSEGVVQSGIDQKSQSSQKVVASSALNNSSFEYDENAVNAEEGTGPSSGGGVLSDDNVTAESAKKIGKDITTIDESRSIGRHHHHAESKSHQTFFEELNHANSANNFHMKQTDTDDDKETRAMTSADERIYSQGQKPPLIAQTSQSQHNQQREQDYANLFSLPASQSIDFLKPPNQELPSGKGPQTTKSSHVIIGQQKQSQTDKKMAGSDKGKSGNAHQRGEQQLRGAGKSHNNSSSRRSSRRNSKRGNSNRQKSREQKKESHLLIQAFVTQLVDTAVQIVNESSGSEGSALRKEIEEEPQKNRQSSQKQIVPEAKQEQQSSKQKQKASQNEPQKKQQVEQTTPATLKTATPSLGPTLLGEPKEDLGAILSRQKTKQQQQMLKKVEQQNQRRDGDQPTKEAQNTQKVADSSKQKSKDQALKDSQVEESKQSQQKSKQGSNDDQHQTQKKNAVEDEASQQQNVTSSAAIDKNQPLDGDEDGLDEADGETQAPTTGGGPGRRRKRNKNKKKDPAELMNNFVRKMHGADVPAGQANRNSREHRQKKGTDTGKYNKESGGQKQQAPQAQQAAQPAQSKEQHHQRGRGGGAQGQQQQQKRTTVEVQQKEFQEQHEQVLLNSNNNAATVNNSNNNNNRRNNCQVSVGSQLSPGVGQVPGGEKEKKAGEGGDSSRSAGKESEQKRNLQGTGGQPLLGPSVADGSTPQTQEEALFLKAESQYDHEKQKSNAATGSQESISGQARAASTGGNKKNQQQKARDQRKQDAQVKAGDSEQKKSSSPRGSSHDEVTAKTESQQTQSLDSGLVGTSSSKGAKSAVDPALASGSLSLQQQSSPDSRRLGWKKEVEQNLQSSPKVPFSAQQTTESSLQTSAQPLKKPQSMTPVICAEKGVPPPDFLSGGKSSLSPATPLEKPSKSHAKGTSSSNKQDSIASKNSSKGGQLREVVQKYSPQDLDQSKSAQAELREKFTALQQAQSQNQAKKLDTATSKSVEQPSESADSSAASADTGRKVNVNVVLDQLDPSSSTGGRPTEKCKDEESKEESDCPPEVQFRPYSEGSDELKLHKGRSMVVGNFPGILAKNDQRTLGSLAVDDTEGDTTDLRMSSSISENPFMSVKAVSFTPSFQPSPTIQSSKPQEPHSSTLPHKGSQTLQNRFNVHMSHDNFNPPGNARTYHATQGGQSPLQNNFMSQSSEMTRFNSGGHPGSSDSPLMEMHQSSNPFKPSADKLQKSQSIPFGGLGHQHPISGAGNSPQFAFQAYNPQFQATSSGYPHPMQMTSSIDMGTRKTESAMIPTKGSGERGKNAQKTSPFGKKSAYKNHNVSEAQQHETLGDHQHQHSKFSSNQKAYYAVNNLQSPDRYHFGSGSGSDQECTSEQQLTSGDRTSTQQQHPTSLHPSSSKHEATAYGGPQSYPPPLNQQHSGRSDFSDRKILQKKGHSSLHISAQGSYVAHGSGSGSPRPRGHLALREQPLSATSHGSYLQEGKHGQQALSGLSSHSGGNATGPDDQYATTGFSNQRRSSGKISKQQSQSSTQSTGQLNPAASQPQKEPNWLTSPSQVPFSPTPFGSYQSPSQQMPHMQLESNPYASQHQNMFGHGSGQGDEEFNQIVPDGSPSFQFQQTSGSNPYRSGHLKPYGAGNFMPGHQAGTEMRNMSDDETMGGSDRFQASQSQPDVVPQVLDPADPSHAQQLENDPVYKMIEDKFYESFDQKILAHTREIYAQIDHYAKEREFVHKKIEEIARTQLNCERLVVRVFGSLITGLALASSDMDMAVSGQDFTDRQALIEDMHTLADGLGNWDLIQELKAIDTASIPVIKAKIDLRKVRLLLSYEEKQNPIEDPGLEAPEEEGDSELEKMTSTKKEAQEDKSEPIDIFKNVDLQKNKDFHFLPVDITFDDSQPDSVNNSLNDMTGGNERDAFMANFGILSGMGLAPFGGLPTAQAKTHLGIASCDLVKDYVGAYPCLREVGILLKEFLNEHELNVAYKGGISSYSAILLIVAYMNNFKLQQSPHITPSRLLMGFLDFYSNCFDSKQYGINILNEMSFYPLPSLSQQMFVIVDPVNPQNNTARNSYRTPDILDHFRDAFSRLKNLVNKQYVGYQENQRALALAWQASAQAAALVAQNRLHSGAESQAQAQEKSGGQEPSDGEEATDRVQVSDDSNKSKAQSIMGDAMYQEERKRKRSRSGSSSRSPIGTTDVKEQQFPQASDPAGQSCAPNDAVMDPSPSNQSVMLSPSSSSFQHNFMPFAMGAMDGGQPRAPASQSMFFASVDIVSTFLSEKGAEALSGGQQDGQLARNSSKAQAK